MMKLARFCANALPDGVGDADGTLRVGAMEAELIMMMMIPMIMMMTMG